MKKMSPVEIAEFEAAQEALESVKHEPYVYAAVRLSVGKLREMVADLELSDEAEIDIVLCNEDAEPGTASLTFEDCGVISCGVVEIVEYGGANNGRNAFAGS